MHRPLSMKDLFGAARAPHLHPGQRFRTALFGLAIGVWLAGTLSLGAMEPEPRADSNPARTENSPHPPDPETLFDGFRIRATGVGQMDAPTLLAFLDSPPPEEAETGESRLFTRGLWLGILGILAGGLLLNLTPCVLPMIPINLAIIGAGARADSKRRGFFLGGAYGLAMALVYGLLGLVVVLTGATFGTLNASPLFNALIACLFLVLALGMFDLLPIDFSRFQGRIDAGKTRSRFLLAFGMGGVAALLAGACVAPVLISVLLLSADLYGRGVAVGLGLPFLLGLGMGLPWPFAGAGLSFLPKPGRWMDMVKYGFGLLIILMALYYGRLAWTLTRAEKNGGPAAAEQAETNEVDGIFRINADGDASEWEAALTRARETGAPVFLDFWATWCRVCLVMQRTTFQDEAVQERFKDFVFIKVQAEQPQSSPTREILSYFDVMGLPTYIILDAKNSDTFGR